MRACFMAFLCIIVVTGFMGSWFFFSIFLDPYSLLSDVLGPGPPDPLSSPLQRELLKLCSYGYPV